MPCTYYTPEEERRMARERESQRLGAEKQKQQKLKSELDRVTRLLCSVMSKVSHIKLRGSYKTVVELDPELAAWWEKHQEMDRRRLAAEAKKREKQAAIEAEKELKQKALNKLTTEEKKALGLD